MTNTKHQTKGVGYFETFFSAVELSTMAETLKQFALKQQVTEESAAGEVLNDFVGLLIKSVDLKEFEQLAPQLFSYPTNLYEGSLEVEQIEASKQQLNYLKENIEELLKQPINTH